MTLSTSFFGLQGFMGAMSYLRLLDADKGSKKNGALELLPVAVVPMDARCQKQPVIYADVIIRTDTALVFACVYSAAITRNDVMEIAVFSTPVFAR